jgi:hypothetical protein
MHYNLVYAQKLGYGGMLDGGNDKADSSETPLRGRQVAGRAGHGWAANNHKGAHTCA